MGRAPLFLQTFWLNRRLCDFEPDNNCCSNKRRSERNGDGYLPSHSGLKAVETTYTLWIIEQIWLQFTMGSLLVSFSTSCNRAFWFCSSSAISNKPVYLHLNFCKLLPYTTSYFLHAFYISYRMHLVSQCQVPLLTIGYLTSGGLVSVLLGSLVSRALYAFMVLMKALVLLCSRLRRMCTLGHPRSAFCGYCSPASCMTRAWSLSCCTSLLDRHIHYG